MLTLLVLKLFLLLTEILRHRMILLLASKFSVCIRFTRDAEPMKIPMSTRDGNTHGKYTSNCMLWMEIIGSRSCTEAEVSAPHAGYP